MNEQVLASKNFLGVDFHELVFKEEKKEDLLGLDSPNIK